MIGIGDINTEEYSLLKKALEEEEMNLIEKLSRHLDLEVYSGRHLVTDRTRFLNRLMIKVGTVESETGNADVFALPVKHPSRVLALRCRDTETGEWADFVVKTHFPALIQREEFWSANLTFDQLAAVVKAVFVVTGTTDKCDNPFFGRTGRAFEECLSGTCSTSLAAVNQAATCSWGELVNVFFLDVY